MVLEEKQKIHAVRRASGDQYSLGHYSMRLAGLKSRCTASTRCGRELAQVVEKDWPAVLQKLEAIRCFGQPAAMLCNVT
jgi:hypothetical protein